MDSRYNKRKERKGRKKKRYRILAVLLLLIFSVVGYSAYQYYEGTKMAKDEPTTLKKDYKFNGTKDANGKINVLLLGIDSRGEQKSRSDTMIVAQYDPKTEQTKMVSLMRDMYVKIPGYQNYKLNTAFFLGGPELLRKTIKENFGLDIQYYMIVDFKGFEKSIDTLAPEGIEINVEKEMSQNIGVTLKPGVQKLHGKELLGYARFRHDAQGDFGRVARQQKVLEAVKEKVLSVGGVAKLPKMIGAVQPYYETNMSKWNEISLLKDVLFNNDKKIKTLTVPVEGSYQNGYYSHAGAVLEVDFDKNRQAIQDFLNGKNQDGSSDSENSSDNQ
ncbi:LCP family protein [Falsibacillus albus]|uniref:Regulatory protein MsrR n=1 Tax=Falsibacillus albus TaxID=2478915 RepID=A0A3L7JXA4_9BACI|nr:LCP family protein [Falsibacillus albus]RLQ95518.1 LytR family transcriptional regulator [Falsibacillus albus]